MNKNENCFIVISPRSLSEVQGLAESLNIALKGELKFKHLDSLEHLSEYFPKENDPNFIVIDVTSKGFADLVLDELKPLLDGMKQLDPFCISFLMTDRSYSSSEIVNAFDLGIAGFFVWKSEAFEISDAVMDLLSARQFMKRSTPRVKARHQVEVGMANMEQAIVSETLTLGTGGMFVNEVPSGLNVGDLIDFKFLKKSFLSEKVKVEGAPFTEDSPEELLSGKARVVWMRRAVKNDLPIGIGLQFSEIDDSLKELIEKYVLRKRESCFIPKK